MARQYPRFLFSNPQNTKSKGPFVVSLMPPILICRALNRNTGEAMQSGHVFFFGNVAVELIGRPYKENPDGSSQGDEVKVMLHEMAKWLDSQVKCGDIEL